MLIARPLQAARLLFLGPIPQQFPPQLLDLLDGLHFGFIRRAARRHRLIHHVGNRMKSGQHARAAVGVNTLPRDASVEVEVIFEARP